MQNMTLEQAWELKRQAVRDALRRNLPKKIKYLCTVDPGNTEGGVYTRPLAGAGVFLKFWIESGGVSRSKKLIVAVELSNRPGKEIFRAQMWRSTTWEIERCRYGLWTDKLENEYARVSFRQGNKEVIDLYEDFGPLPNGKAG